MHKEKQKTKLRRSQRPLNSTYKVKDIIGKDQLESLRKLQRTLPESPKKAI